MNISTIQNYSYQPLFQARKKPIKEADKILRTTKEAFPLVSSSYILSRYSCAKPNSKHREQALKVANRIFSSIESIRIKEKSASIFEKNENEKETFAPFVDTINSSRFYKTGNCKEQVCAAIGVLAANGYYNSKYTRLALEVTVIKRSTFKEVYKKDIPLGHVLVLTDMNREDCDIVIDPWLGFADSKEAAIARYKCLVSGIDMKNAMEKAKRLYLDSMDFPDDENRYITIGRLKLLPFEHNKDEIEKLGEYMKENYPEVVVI